MVEDAGDAAAARAKASWADDSCPPDQQLDALFLEFARQRRGTPTLPFVKQRRVEYEQRVKTGLFSSRIEKETRYEHDEVTQGWEISAIGHHFSVNVSKLDTARVWYGLAVDIDGKPWLAQHACSEHSYWGPIYTDQVLRVDGRRGKEFDNSEPLLGRPTTRSCPTVFGWSIEGDDGRIVPCSADNDDLRSVIMYVCLTHGGGTSREGLADKIASAMGIPLPRSA